MGAGFDLSRSARASSYTELLEANDFAVETLFHAFFASIPYEWYTNNDIANYEGYYASVFYSWFRRTLGLDTSRSKTAAATAGLDMAVLFNDTVYLFEFKVVEMASRVRRWRSCRSGAMPTSIAPWASRFT